MILLLCALLQDRDSVRQDFTYKAEKTFNVVYVAGTFNNWSNGANAMKMDPDGRTWRLTLPLNPGKHLYKFVLEGKDWITDPKAAKNEDDGNGNVNSVLFIMPKDYGKTAVLGDGLMTASALRHDTEPPYFNYDRGRLQLSLRVRPNDMMSATVVVNGVENALKEQSRDEFYQVLRTSVDWNRKSDLKYVFKLSDGPGVKFFGPKGLTDKASGNEFVLSAAAFKPFTVPAWTEGAVFYQIFPDRFENGDKSNDPANLTAWDAKPTGDSRMGGDAAGISQRLGYLKDLGIGAIYFNPLFVSPVSHRYETTDFKKVDPQFGTQQEFATMTKSLQKAGIKTVLDGVFNHTAPDFFAFQDVLDNQEKSRYTDWFFIKKYPVKVEDNPNYIGWWGIKSMPKLNVLNKEVREHLLSVPEYWAKNATIHGWRLDAANEVDSEFWKAFRSKVKGLNPQNWIVGEVWGDGTPWLKGDQWDSIMGYQFRDATIKFVAEGSIKPSDFMRRLTSVYSSYAPQVSRNLMNLLSSHDTPRFLTLCKGDRKLAMLAATIQLTWPGSPCIYYGEEIGMEGEHDPGCRAGMEWDKANAANPMLGHYKKLIAARKNSKALRIGEPENLSVLDNDKVIVYSRSYEKEFVYIAINRSDEARQVQIPVRNGKLRELFTGKVMEAKEGSLMIDLPPLSSAVLQPVSPLDRSHHAR